MLTIHYLDFDLAIESVPRTRTRYRARVLNSPAGQASTEFRLPFSKFELENYILKIGRTRQGARSLNSAEGRAAQEFGRRLYDAIFQDQVRDCLRRSLDVATQRPGQGLRIRLRLTAAQGLSDLPWEYLYDVPFKRFFVHSQTTPIIRYLDLPQGTQPLTVQLPLNVLVMIANPRDYGQLDVEVEWHKVQEALADLVQRELVTLTRLESATLGALQRQLRRMSYHIFHFIGHGGFDQQTQAGVLLLEDDKGLLRMVAGSYLGMLLHDHPTLQLAVLNACEGARTAHIDPLAGVAQILVHQGIPAVIAMQFEITDHAAIILAHEFYTALADGYPVDAALTEARKAIYAAGNDVEWGTPVLYMRSPDGQIFDVPAMGKGQPAFIERLAAARVAPQAEESTSLVQTFTPAIEPVEPPLEQQAAVHEQVSTSVVPLASLEPEETVVTASSSQLTVDEGGEVQSLSAPTLVDLSTEPATEKSVVADPVELVPSQLVAEPQTEQVPQEPQLDQIPRWRQDIDQEPQSPTQLSPSFISRVDSDQRTEGFPNFKLWIDVPLWVLANAVGWVVGGIIGMRVGAGVNWAVIGAIQWFIVRRYISQPYWWIWGITIGGIVIQILGWIFAWFEGGTVEWVTAVGGFAVINGSRDLYFVNDLSPGGIIYWIVLGITQWFTLSRFIPRVYWWILASIIGGIVGSLVYFLIGVNEYGALMNQIIGGLLIGATYGIFTGIAFFWILQRPTVNENTG